MHPAFIILIFYYSMSCMVVTWAGFNVGMERIQEVEYAEDFGRGDWVKWFILTFFVWPIMIPELVKDTRAIIRKMSPYPRCLKCGSPEVIERQPRVRKIPSDYDREWRERVRQKQEEMGWTNARDLDSRGVEETVREYRHYLLSFYARKEWGDCEDCQKQLNREDVEEHWPAYNQQWALMKKENQA